MAVFGLPSKHAHSSRAFKVLTAQLALTDPRDRLTAQLSELDETIKAAKARTRWIQSQPYNDPDGNTVIKCLELGAKLVNDYHARTLSSVESIGTLDRAQAIAELEAVLAVWKDPAVSDEQWKASRQAAPPVEVKPRAGVVRRKKA
jgi:hypothetical protein